MEREPLLWADNAVESCSAQIGPGLESPAVLTWRRQLDLRIIFSFHLPTPTSRTIQMDLYRISTRNGNPSSSPPTRRSAYVQQVLGLCSTSRHRPQPQPDSSHRHLSTITPIRRPTAFHFLFPPSLGPPVRRVASRNTMGATFRIANRKPRQTPSAFIVGDPWMWRLALARFPLWG